MPIAVIAHQFGIQHSGGKGRRWPRSGVDDIAKLVMAQGKCGSDTRGNTRK